MKKYALKYKGKFEFICVSNDLTEFQDKMMTAFWNWKGLQPRNYKDLKDVATIEDYLSVFDKVVIEITKFQG